jgi:7-cyano-7-deazaguanine synthase in queuosine biosynthesis
MAEKPRAIVLLSGGLNSAVMFYDLLTFKKVEIVECMIFDCWTLHKYKSARELCERTGAPYSVWDASVEPVIDYNPPNTSREDRRAVVFMTIIINAVIRAELLRADTIIAGFSEQTLPITKPDFTDFCTAAGRCSDLPVKFDFPFMESPEWEVFDLARKLNRLAEVTSESSSCDEGIDDIQHPWGYGCGSCDGCVARWRAWDEYLQNLKARLKA